MKKIFIFILLLLLLILSILRLYNGSDTNPPNSTFWVNDNLKIFLYFNNDSIYKIYGKLYNEDINDYIEIMSMYCRDDKIISIHGIFPMTSSLFEGTRRYRKNRFSISVTNSNVSFIKTGDVIVFNQADDLPEWALDVEEKIAEHYFGENDNTIEPIFISSCEYLEALSLDEIVGSYGRNVIFERFHHGHHSGKINEIKGRFTTIEINTREDALKALTSVRDIMNIESFSYAVEKDERYTHQNVFILTQVYNGIEVFNGIFKIFVTDTGIPTSVNGVYINIVDLNTTPTNSMQQARDIFNIEDVSWVEETKLVIYEIGKDDVRLCWFFNVDSMNPKDIRWIFIDAHNREKVMDSIMVN